MKNANPTPGTKPTSGANVSNPAGPTRSEGGRGRTRSQQGASIARREALATRRTPAGTARTRPAQPARAASRPMSAYRMIAAFALVLLLFVSLFGGSTASTPNTAPLLTPGITGANSVQGGVDQVMEQVFRYRTVVEQNQANTIPDNLVDILHYPSNSTRARQTIVGQMFASTSGNLNLTLAETGFFSGLNEEKLTGVESLYNTFISDEQRNSRGLNGLGVMYLVRSINATGVERAGLEGQGLGAISNAISVDPNTWQFTYNWSLANLLIGNYSTAFDGMRGISSLADADNVKYPPFWMGLAALRMGDPGEALTRFRSVVDMKISEGNQAYQDQLVRLREAAREGYADAQWANREPEATYTAYYNVLANGNTDDTGLYTKWLRLGLNQRAYERLASDLAGLQVSGGGFSKSARIRHDRARLLTFLGRTAEAENEYKQAIALSPNDAGLLVAYGQFLESRNDHNGALGQAEQAIAALGKGATTTSDPASDLTGVASAAVLTTTSAPNLYAAQQLLDANLLRARAYAGSGRQNSVETLANNIAGGAAGKPANQAGLINLYAGFAAEAAGLNDKAVEYYSAAWNSLKGLNPGSAGRAAALAGLARATAGQKDAAAGIAVLAGNGYDPAALKPAVSTDLDGPDILLQAALLLNQQGKQKEAANAMRVSALSRNLQDAHTLTGAGRPLWQANGTIVPADALLTAADAASQAPGSDVGLSALRYKQLYSLAPAMAAAWNNLGVAYAQEGNSELAGFYTGASGKVSPEYALGRHNQAALEYKQGIGNFFDAEAAQAGAIRAAGPGSLAWGSDVRADNREPFPAPTQQSTDFWGRLPAILIALLLLVHTIIGNDRMTNRMGVLPAKGALGTLAGYLDKYVRQYLPGTAKPASGTNALLLTVLVPSVIGMFALAIAAGRGSLGVALVYLPVALLAALLAFAANEFAQQWQARRRGATTAYHLWPLGVILGVLCIPFGVLYGWQKVTRLLPGTASSGDSKADASAARRARTDDELDLAYEARAEALAEQSPDEDLARMGAPVATALPSGALLDLSPAASILFAGLAANMLLVLIFGAAYWLTAWPSLRLAMYASTLVLAFTAVSEPPAEGWTLYRRNPSLWLAVFVIAAALAVLLGLGLI